MADTKADAKDMLDLYNKGVTPDEIGEKYNLTGQQVVDIVTKPVQEEQPVTQVEEDSRTQEVKKK